MNGLYLYSSSSNRAHEARIARERFKITSTPVPVGSWEELAKLIGLHSHLDRLVLSFHGYRGGMIVGGKALSLDELRVKALFSKPGRLQTRVSEIIFFGCNVGNNPDKMNAFGQIFEAKRVAGYTWSIVHQEIGIKFDTGTDEASIKRAFEPYAEYATAMPASHALAIQARVRPVTVALLVLYGSAEAETAKFPLRMGSERKFKPLDAATTRTVRVVGGSGRNGDESPVHPFEYVVVSNGG